MRISDWSSDVCSSDLPGARAAAGRAFLASPLHDLAGDQQEEILDEVLRVFEAPELALLFGPGSRAEVPLAGWVESVAGPQVIAGQRSEERRGGTAWVGTCRYRWSPYN